MYHGLRLNVRSGLAGLESLRQDWLYLFSLLDAPALCHDWRWVATLVAALYHDDLLLCAVYDGDLPVAIFYFWHGLKKRGPLSYQALESPTNPEFIVLSDGIISPDYRQASLLRFVLKGLNRNRLTDWDVFSISNCTERSVIGQLEGVSQYIESTGNANAFFTCPSPASLESLSRKQLKNLNRCRRRAEREMGAVVTASSTATTLAASFRAFTELENRGWKGTAGLGTSILASGQHALHFYQQLLTYFSEKGDVLVYTLSVAETQAAAALCLRVGSVLYVYKIAYDETFHQYSPGGLLLLDIFTEMAARTDVNEVNLLTCPKWSARWHIQQSAVIQVRVYNKSVRAFLFRVLRNLRNICQLWPRRTALHKVEV